MEGFIIVIAVIWAVFSFLMKGLKAANQSGQNRRPGQAPPGDARPRPQYPPLTPTVRPGGTGAPDWGDIMTMLGGGGETQPRQPSAGEGESTEAFGPSGSLTGPSMMEGPDMMDGSARMMGEAQSSYEGAALPGETPVPPPAPGIPVAPPLRSAVRPRRYNSAAMRDAVVWAEILAKPKSLRRVAR